MANYNGGRSSNNVPFTGRSSEASTSRASTSASDHSSSAGSSNQRNSGRNREKIFPDDTYENLARRIYATARTARDEQCDINTTHRRILEAYTDELVKMKEIYDRVMNERR